MEMAAKPFASGKRETVSDARLAYFEGDFERCLEICTQIRVSSLTTASEVALLRARALLRLGCPSEAETVIADSFETHISFDASLTARMLLASARIRQSDPDTGIAMLESVAAHSAGAHFAIRSEIAFATALGYWAKRDIDRAEHFLESVDRRSDIIHARALELSAWCQTARGNYRRSADLFILTLVRLDSCRARDRAIGATAISTLSILAAELFDHELARVAEHHARTMDWTSGLVTQRYLTLLHQALFAEFCGNTIEAYELAMRAREIAPTTAFEACAWSVTSLIARNADETAVAAVFAQRAAASLATLELREISGEERFSILAVAESCAPFDSTNADRLFAAYWGLAPADKMLALSGDPRLAAEETFVGGVIAQARGERENALRCYRLAADAFARLGYVRRAVVAAAAVLKLEDDEPLRRYIRDQLSETENYITRSVAQAGDDPMASSVEEHPIVAALPPAQREVVVLICQGKTNREIAALRNVGEQTIKNMLTKHVFRAFGVTNRAALVSTCLRQSG